MPQELPEEGIVPPALLNRQQAARLLSRCPAARKAARPDLGQSHQVVPRSLDEFVTTAGILSIRAYRGRHNNHTVASEVYGQSLALTQVMVGVIRSAVPEMRAAGGGSDL